MFFNTSCHVPCYTVFVSHFSPFSGFLPYSKSYSVHFSYSTFVSISCYLPGNTLFVSLFSSFLGFLAIFQVLKCEFRIFHVFFFQFPRHITGPKVCIIIFFSVSCHISGLIVWICHFPPFSLFCHIPDSTVWVYHFPCFSIFKTYSRSYSVHFSFFTFLVFLAVFQII